MANHKLYALVTGGNRGIGLEVCKHLVEQKKPVLLACRNVEAGKAVAADLAKAGSDVQCLQLDTSSAAGIAQVADIVKTSYNQKIDLLINNAGILVGGVWDSDTYNQTLATNTSGPVLLSQALLPYLAPGAVIINVSSGLGKLDNLSSDYRAAVLAVNKLDDLAKAAEALPFNSNSPMGSSAPGQGGYTPTYSVAKALLNRATQLMAAEVAFKARGVSVVSVCPGWCRTDMGGSAADRSVLQGASSVLWPYWHWDSTLSGSFTRDGARMEW